MQGFWGKPVGMAEEIRVQPTTQAAPGACVWPGPPDIRDAGATAKITFNWLKTSGSGDKPPAPQPEAPAPIGAILFLLLAAIVGPAALGAWCAAVVDWRAGVPIFLILALISVSLIYLWLGLGTAGPPAPPKPKPKPVDGALRAWKQARAKREFWERLGATKDGYGFEIECAELCAAIFQTRDVAITRGSDDYGVDIMICKDGKRHVAQCKLSSASPPSIGTVRELAGSTSFFGASTGLLFSLQKISELRVQAGEFARVCHLQYWDLEAILAFAQRLAKD